MGSEPCWVDLFEPIGGRPIRGRNSLPVGIDRDCAVLDLAHGCLPPPRTGAVRTEAPKSRRNEKRFIARHLRDED